MHIFDRIGYIRIPLYTTSKTDGLVEATTCRRDNINDKWLFITDCGIFWIQYYIGLPHSTVTTATCCVLAVGFLPTSWGARTACHTKLPHHRLAFQHTWIHCGRPNVLYMHPANITVSLKSDGNRNVKHTEAMDCGLQKWYLFTSVLRCYMCINGDRHFPDTHQHTCKTDTHNKNAPLHLAYLI
jgi:hypothetical protein